MALLWTILAVTGPASAQDTAVTGTVTDAVLPGVTVTALHVDSGYVSVGVTDASANTGLARRGRRVQA